MGLFKEKPIIPVEISEAGRGDYVVMSSINQVRGYETVTYVRMVGRFKDFDNNEHAIVEQANGRLLIVTLDVLSAPKRTAEEGEQDAGPADS